MIVVSVKAPAPPAKCLCSLVADSPPPTTAPEATVITTWNDRGIEVQVA
jgi:hypothetical protein